MTVFVAVAAENPVLRAIALGRKKDVADGLRDASELDLRDYLHHALYANRPEIVELLIEQKAPIWNSAITC